MTGAERRDAHAVVARRLAAVGQRYTAGRRRLIGALLAAEKPLPIGDLLTASALPQSSAYRNLAVLEQAGAVRRVVTDEDFARYELAETLTEHHHHLICSACGRVEDVTIPAALEADVDRTVTRLAKRSGFATVAHRLDLIGTCGDCVAGRSGRASSGATA
ncbi:MAG TPA: Fur family transcriptional regulator [Actinomycetota bacterium]|nr:Fur family transcriptional regulator [Actinomycetota bacterium]